MKANKYNASKEKKFKLKTKETKKNNYAERPHSNKTKYEKYNYW